MKKSIKHLVFISLVIAGFVFACAKKEDNEETILTGSMKILVDETLTPIIEDQQAVFENEYDAKLNLISQSEKEAIVSLSKRVADVIILPRKLSAEEEKLFVQKKIHPRTTEFAKDAIAFIRNNKSTDTLISIAEVVQFLKGEPSQLKGLVFDNPNSSSVNYITKLAGLKSLPEKGVYSFKTNNEVIKYVAENDGMVGVVGINWVFQPSSEMVEIVDQINVLSVRSTKSNQYFSPSQENIATGDYPLARDLYIINCQGYQGLGMGFASFIAGEKGQRIILKSGLAPIRVPGRNIRIRNKLETK